MITGDSNEVLGLFNGRAVCCINRSTNEPPPPGGGELQFLIRNTDLTDSDGAGFIDIYSPRGFTLILDILFTQSLQFAYMDLPRTMHRTSHYASHLSLPYASHLYRPIQSDPLQMTNHVLLPGVPTHPQQEDATVFTSVCMPPQPQCQEEDRGMRCSPPCSSATMRSLPLIEIREIHSVSQSLNLLRAKAPSPRRA